MMQAYELSNTWWHGRGNPIYGNAWSVSREAYDAMDYILDTGICMLTDAAYNCACCKDPECWVCRDGRYKYLENFKEW